MTRPACVVIDTQAARANLATVRRIAPKQKVMAIIKADAYGHGLVRMARAFADADAFGVACLEEARELREDKITQPIVLLEGPFSGQELQQLSERGIQTVIHHDAQIDMLESLSASQAVTVWLKIDTGMHRLGFAPERTFEVLERLRRCSAVNDTIRLMTHMACAQDNGGAMVREQLARFAGATQGLNGERLHRQFGHLDGLAGGTRRLGTAGDHALRRVPVQTRCTTAEHRLRPVMTVRSALIAVNRVGAGEAVGYGATWRCKADQQVGVVAFGYGDGYPRHAASGTAVLVNGRRAALIGKASMDMLSVDLREVPNAQVGDEVVLWGEGLPVEEVALSANTIAYELLCSVGLRACYVEIDGTAPDQTTHAC